MFFIARVSPWNYIRNLYRLTSVLPNDVEARFECENCEIGIAAWFCRYRSVMVLEGSVMGNVNGRQQGDAECKLIIEIFCIKSEYKDYIILLVVPRDL